jgi:hypothetical protein
MFGVFKNDKPIIHEFHALLPDEDAALQYMKEHLISEEY